jgi:hypothetical protein
MESLPRPPFSPGAPDGPELSGSARENMREIWYGPADLLFSELAIYQLLAEDNAPPKKS